MNKNQFIDKKIQSNFNQKPSHYDTPPISPLHWALILNLFVINLFSCGMKTRINPEIDLFPTRHSLIFFFIFVFSRRRFFCFFSSPSWQLISSIINSEIFCISLLIQTINCRYFLSVVLLLFSPKVDKNWVILQKFT